MGIRKSMKETSKISDVEESLPFITLEVMIHDAVSEEVILLISCDKCTKRDGKDGDKRKEDLQMINSSSPVPCGE